MEPRPKIKLTLSAFDHSVEQAAKIILLALWGLTVYAFLNLPQTIPVHFNAAGKPDNYGNKLTLLIFTSTCHNYLFWYN